MPPPADQPTPTPGPSASGPSQPPQPGGKPPTVPEAVTAHFPSPVGEPGHRVPTMPASPAVPEAIAQQRASVSTPAAVPYPGTVANSGQAESAGPAGSFGSGSFGTSPSGSFGTVPRRAGELVPRAKAMLRPPLPLPPTAGNLLRALRYRWKPALVLGLGIGLIVGTVTWLLLPRPDPVYAATSAIRVAYTDPRVVFPVASSDKSDFVTYLRTQLDLIRSRAVLQPALRFPKAAELASVKQNSEDVLRWMEKELKAELGSGSPTPVGPEYKSEVVRVTLTGTSPDELVVLVNAIKNSYLQEVVNRQQKERQDRIPLLETLFRDAQNQLRTNREAWQRAAVQGGAEAEQRLLRQYDEYVKALNATELDLMRAQLRWNYLEKNPPRPLPSSPAAVMNAAPKLPTVSDRMVEDQVERDREILAGLQKVGQLQARLEYFEKIATDQAKRTSPDYLADKAEYKELLQAVDKRRGELRPQVRKELENEIKERYGQQTPPAAAPTPPPVAETEADRAKQELAILQDEYDRLKKEVDRKSEDVSKSIELRQNQQSKKLDDMEARRVEIERLDTHCKFVLDELEAVRTEAHAPPRAITLFDAQEAVAVPRADPLREVKLTSLAGFGALFLTVLGVSFLEFRARRIYQPEDVADQLGMRVLGVLPNMPEEVRTQAFRTDGLDDLYRRNVFASAVDSLRTVLLHEAAGNGARVLMVGSAVEGEGKTTLASNLAVSLARAGKRTLLVDADLVHPAAHAMFGLPPQPGLADLLREQGSVADLVRPTPAPGLWLLPAGQADPAAIRALDQNQVGRIFERLKAEYDVIVVDSSPLLPLAQSMLIGKGCDAVVLTVLHGTSRVLPVYAGYHRLAILGVPVMGAVFLGAQGPAYAYSYGHGGSVPQGVSEELPVLNA